MPAAVETMFYRGKMPWHKLGTPVAEAPDSEAALALAGLDWAVGSEPVFDPDMAEIEGYKANVRSSDRKVLGIVSDRYKILQNREAFTLADDLLGAGVRFETAGSLRGGRVVWLLTKLQEEARIMGDAHDVYLTITNSHDGSGAVRMAVTPVRVVCMNTLAMALKRATRSWSARHTLSVTGRVAEAREALDLTHEYVARMQAEADRLAGLSMRRPEWEALCRELLPIPEGLQGGRLEAQEDRQAELMAAIEADDLSNFRWTRWGAMQAVADFRSHAEPLRHTARADERKMESFIGGDKLLQKAMAILEA